MRCEFWAAADLLSIYFPAAAPGVDRLKRGDNLRTSYGLRRRATVSRWWVCGNKSSRSSDISS